MLQLMREGCSYTYTYRPLSISRYSFIQLSELDQCRVKKLAQGFNTAARVSNQGPLKRESEVLRSTTTEASGVEAQTQSHNVNVVSLRLAYNSSRPVQMKSYRLSAVTFK